MKIKLDIREDKHGRQVLHFPFMTLSDIHLGTKYARTKRLCQFLSHASVDELHLIGDIIDGEAMVKKDVAHWGEYHPQVVAYFIRMAAQGADVYYEPGNHEGYMPERFDIGKEGRPLVLSGALDRSIDLAPLSDIFGIKAQPEGLHVDPLGRRMMLIHGHQMDKDIVKSTKHQKLVYRLGSQTYEQMAEKDLEREERGEPLIGYKRKRQFKKIYQWVTGMDKRIAAMAVEQGVDGVIYGHTHIFDFNDVATGTKDQKTRKLIMNDGSCAEHINALVHDEEGHYAVLEFHHDYMIVHEPDGPLEGERVDFENGAFAFMGEPHQWIEDEALDEAKHVLRIAEWLYPSRAQQEAHEAGRAELPSL